MAAGPGHGDYAPTIFQPAIGNTVDRVPSAANCRTTRIVLNLDCLRSLGNHNLRQADREVPAGGWHRAHRLGKGPPAEVSARVLRPRLAGGSVTDVDPGGPVMTVTYGSPRLNRIGSPHSLTLTHEEGSNADVGSSQAAPGNPIGGTG